VGPGGEHGPVVSRPHLSLVPANGLRGRLGATTVRILGILVLLAAALILLYAGARFTSLFALEKLELTGGGPAAREQVRTALRPLVGESLVALDQADLRRELEALPAVRSARVDRAFPHTLRIAIVHERPLAVVQSGEDAWLVSAQGRVIRAVDPEHARKRPVVVADPGSSFAPGATVHAEDVRTSLDALRRLPKSFPERVASASATGGAVTLVLAGGMEVRLGEARSLALKLAVAGRVLRSLSRDEAAGLAYLDVSVPERAVGGTALNSQLEG
jgi:cell division protein FtsQ